MKKISFGLDLLTRITLGMQPLWKEAGNLESRVVHGRIKSIAIDRPVFISGLARGGSTLLLEYLARHDHVATHQQRDFPFILTPGYARMLTACVPHASTARERAHGDGLTVTPHSPEGMEEIIWRAFKTHDARFAAFYRAHIKKLLMLTGASRYVAKNNHLSGRLTTVFSLFPDARMIVPLRDPVSQVESLMRQHARFMDLAAQDKRVVRHMRAQGHDEFGPLHKITGDAIMHWAQEWNRVYGAFVPYLKDERVLVVPHEAFCASPQAWLENITQHAQLPLDAALVAEFAAKTTSRREYDDRLDDTKIARIRSLTADVNANFTAGMLP